MLNPLELDKPLDWQSEVMADEANYKVIVAGRQIGKTILARMLIKWKGLLTKGGANIAFIAPTRPHAISIMMDQAKLLEYLGDLLIKKDDKLAKIRMRNKESGVESLIQFFGWNDQEIVKIRGGKYDLIIIDEAAYCKDLRKQYQLTVEPVFATIANPEAWFFSTPNGHNDFYYMWEAAKTADRWNAFHFTYRDNEHISAEFIRNVRKNMDAERFKQEYEGLFISVAGLVYRAFSHTDHVFKKQSDQKDVLNTIVGVDFGHGESGITAIVKINLLQNKRYEVVEEKMFPGTASMIDITGAISRMNPDAVFADPAVDQMTQDLIAAGLPVMPVVKGPGSVMRGVKVVADIIAQDRLFVSRKCEHVLGEFGGYIWEEHKIGVEQKPQKGNDHFMDAIRYPLMMIEQNVTGQSNQGGMMRYAQQKKYNVQRRKWRAR